MPKPWTEHNYLEAIGAVGGVSDPELKAQLEQRIRQYERSKGPGFSGAATGIEAFEERTGMSLPSDRKTRDAEHAESQNPKLPDVINEGKKYARPKEIRGEKYNPQPYWYEPSLEEFQAEMRPVLGDEVLDVTEDSSLFQRYADAKWAQAYDQAEKTGNQLVRAKDTEGLDSAIATGTKYLRSGALAVEEGLTGGLAGAGAAKIAEALGDEDAEENLARERAMGGDVTRVGGNIAGILSPASIFSKVGGAASRLVAPAAGKLIVKGGGKAVPRALGRGAVAASAGGAGMAAQGAAEDVAQGANPFSLDFLGRRGTDALVGGAAGVGSELLGTAASRLGNLGPVQNARSAVREGAQNAKLNPILAAGGGGLLGASFETIDNDQRAFNMLVGASIGLGTGMGASIGRYALLNHLGKSAAVAGEPAFKGMAKRLSAAPLSPDVVAAIRERMVTKGAEVFGGRAPTAAVPGLPATPSTPGAPGVAPRFVDVSQPGSRARGRRTPGEGETPMGTRPPRRREALIPGRAPGPEIPGEPAIPGIPASLGRPPQTGPGGGGPFGIPFTGGPDAQPTTLTPDEAEAFILDLIEEDRLEQEEMQKLEEDEGDTEPQGGEVEPIGFGGLPSSAGAALPEVLVRSGIFDESPEARQASKDPEFAKALNELSASLDEQGVGEEEKADILDGYVRNYAAWRASMDSQGTEDEAEGIVRDRSTEVKVSGRFDTQGFGGNDVVEDRQASERTRALQASDLPKMEKLLQTRNPKGYDIEDVIALVQRTLSKNGLRPSPELVEQSMKNLGYPIPKGWAKSAVSQRRRGEVAL